MFAATLVFLAATVSAQDAAQSPAPTRKPGLVYKCKDAKTGALTFSQVPCAADAATVDTSKALRSGPANSAVTDISDSVTLTNLDIECRQRRQSIAERYGREVDEIDAAIARLRSSKAYSYNNTAGATRNVGIETQIGTYEQRRTSLIESSRDEQRSVDEDCRDRRKAEVARQVEARKPPTRETAVDKAGTE